jgi:hypothetical protein
MSTSFVTLGRTISGTLAGQGDQVGFWINDADLELLLRLLALHIPDPASSRTAAAEDERIALSIRDGWLLASRGWFLGCVPHGLEDAADTDAGMAVVRTALTALLAALTHMPDGMPGGVGTLLGIEGIYTEDIPIWRLRACAKALQDLLDGRIATTSRDSVVIPGPKSTGR